jgi:CHAD domain-containing protein
MKDAPSTLYLLDAEAARTLGAGSLGTLVPEVQDTGAISTITLLDQIDDPLMDAERILLETPEGLNLIDRRGRSLQSEGPGRGRLVADLPEGPVREALSRLSPLRSLQPKAEGKLERMTVAWRDAEGKTHCRLRLDLMTAGVGPGLAMARVIEVRGYDRARADLTAGLVQAGAVPFSAARMMAHFGTTRLAPTATPEEAIRPDRQAFDLACDIVARHLSQARAREAGVIDDLDTEFLHDYRVALRRVRSVLSLFRGVFAEDVTLALKTRLAALMAATGAQRDLDVFLLDRAASYALVPPILHPGLDAKFALLARRRAAERNRLARHLRSDGYAREMASLEALFRDRAMLDPGPRAAEPVAHYARSLIARRYRRLCAHAAELGPATGDAELHALRIYGKKLRYLIEFFAPLFPSADLRQVVRPLKALQDSLGVINDCAVQQGALQELLRGAVRRGQAPGLDVAQSVGALTAVLHQRQSAENAVAMDRLAEFAGPKMRGRMRRLLKGLERHMP